MLIFIIPWKTVTITYYLSDDYVFNKDNAYESMNITIIGDSLTFSGSKDNRYYPDITINCSENISFEKGKHNKITYDEKINPYLDFVEKIYENVVITYK